MLSCLKSSQKRKSSPRSESKNDYCECKVCSRIRSNRVEAGIHNLVISINLSSKRDRRSVLVAQPLLSVLMLRESHRGSRPASRQVDREVSNEHTTPR